MKLFRRLENFFGNRIEGFFRHKFNDTLHPVEIAKALVSEMEEHCNVSVSAVYVPNRYTVYFHSDKLAMLTDIQHTLRNELQSYLLHEIRGRGYTVSDQIEILFEGNDDLEQNNFLIEVAFTESNEPIEQNTIIFDSAVPVMEQGHAGFVPMGARLRVLEGVQPDVVYPVGRKRVSIGRWEGNEICLRDPSLSRVHAVIEFGEDAHVLTDARSLNGTYVNGQRVSHKTLHNGDQIRVGQTVLLYEVNIYER